MRLFVTLVTIILLIGCNREDGQRKTIKAVPLIEIEEAIHFYTIGDWGRNGKNRQAELADVMNIAGKTLLPDFIITTGDNFYPEGVSGLDDPIWLTSYENIYKGEYLLCPWYVALGNHDYIGSIDAQVAYTQSSSRWKMPSQYYYQDVELNGTTARIIFIDTTPLHDAYYVDNEYPKIFEQDTSAQMLWLTNALDVSVNWKIVVGHHPFYTGGFRKDETSWVRKHLENLFIDQNVDLYLAGHEHDLQHIKPPLGPTHYFVSGAGSHIRETGTMEYSLFSKSIQGFLATSITKDSLYNQFVDVNGKIIYSASIKKE